MPRKHNSTNKSRSRVFHEEILDVVDPALDEHPAVIAVDMLFELLPGNHAFGHVDNINSDKL
jgi:hypothetical protein